MGAAWRYSKARLHCGSMTAADEMMETETVGPGAGLARWAFRLGMLAPLLGIGGALLAYREIVGPYVGFRIFFFAAPLSILAIIFALIALFKARAGRNPRARGFGLAGLCFGVATLAGVLGLALPSAGFPIINDVSTDLEDPPAFVHALKDPANEGRDMSYPEQFASEQKRAYPGIVTHKVSIPPVEALARMQRNLEELPNTRITEFDRAAGRIEAVGVSRVFHFVDDIVVRVRDSGRGGSIIDVRSKSRHGRGDMGVNAQRIELLYVALQ